MPRPFLLVQLSDPHLGAAWVPADPADRLAAAVEAVRRLAEPPDAVLVSGDVTDDASPDGYALARELLARLGAPVYVLPGNHDDRAALRDGFGLPGIGGDPILYAADLGPVRLVVLDTIRPGADEGQLDRERLEWLDAALAEALGQPALVAMHHPPLATGIPAWDAIGLHDQDRLALGAVLERHPHVQAIVGGHVHRSIVGELAGCAVITVPSTYVQTKLDFEGERIELAEEEPAAFAVHTLVGERLVSHIQPV